MEARKQHSAGCRRRDSPDAGRSVVGIFPLFCSLAGSYLGCLAADTGLRWPAVLQIRQDSAGSAQASHAATWKGGGRFEPSLRISSAGPSPHPFPALFSARHPLLCPWLFPSVAPSISKNPLQEICLLPQNNANVLLGCPGSIY